MDRSVTNADDVFVMAVSQDDEKDRRAVMTVYAVFFTVFIGQVSLFCWRRFHRRSFELVTLIGLWLVPSLFSLSMHFWRFLSVWLVYSVVTGYLLWQCLFKDLSSLTPRRVYTWFFTVYRISLVLGVGGYAALLIELFGMAPLFLLLGIGEVPTLLLWYGLYFGILGRDCAEIASDWMQSGVMGGRRQLGVEIHKCAICKKDLSDAPGLPEESNAEKSVQLNCKHIFHEFCIRGWTLIGKKDICPICGEKVDLKALYANQPWETTNLTWIKMLNVARYLIVWNPLLFFALHCILYLAGFEEQRPSQQERL